MLTHRFRELLVARTVREAEGAVAITFKIDSHEIDNFMFEPGQFLTLKAEINGEEVRRNYSISSSRSRMQKFGEIEIGIRPVEGGIFSNWAAGSVSAGDHISVMPPEGRFVVKKTKAIHRVGFAAGSGITPILSIIATTLEEQQGSKFTLVYGNRRMASVMFNEQLQDLKDKYPERLTLIHVLSRQAQEFELLQGRINGSKVKQLIETVLPVESMDEIFICGPEEMIDQTESTLVEAGVNRNRIRTERFGIGASQKVSKSTVPTTSEQDLNKDVSLTVTLAGKRYDLLMSSCETLLDAALSSGLDLPYSCKAGVCCTCRAKVTHGQIEMEKNFTLEADEVTRGFVLTCQAKPIGQVIHVNYDEF